MRMSWKYRFMLRKNAKEAAPAPEIRVGSGPAVAQPNPRLVPFGPEEPCIAAGEDAAAGCEEPVATSVGSRGHPTTGFAGMVSRGE
jgi:hypothetical protein